jgi:hypothetical protein
MVCNVEYSFFLRHASRKRVMVAVDAKTPAGGPETVRERAGSAGEPITRTNGSLVLQMFLSTESLQDKNVTEALQSTFIENSKPGKSFH